MNLAAYELALKDASIAQIEKNVLRYIIFRCRADTGVCFFTLHRASQELDISPCRISRAIKWLREKNYVTTKFNGKLLVFELCSWSKAGLSQEQSSIAPRTNRTRREQANELFPPKRVSDEPLSEKLQKLRDKLLAKERKNCPEQLAKIRTKEQKWIA